MQLLRPCLSALLLAALARGDTPNPAADPASVVSCGRARFSVLSPSLLRLEFSASRVFSDAATLQVVNRRFPVPAFTVARPNATACVISTAALSLTFDDVDVPGSCAGGARAGTDKASGARLPAFPDGARAVDAGACCALCAGAAGCAATGASAAGRSAVGVGGLQARIRARNHTRASPAALIARAAGLGTRSAR